MSRASSRIEARSCCGLFLALNFYFSLVWQKQSLKIHQNVLMQLWSFLFSRWFFFKCLIFWKASNWSIAMINTEITAGGGQIWGLHISLVRSGFKFSWQLCYTFARCLTLSVFCKVPPSITLSLEHHVHCRLTNTVSNWAILELMQSMWNTMGNLTGSLAW